MTKFISIEAGKEAYVDLTFCKDCKIGKKLSTPSLDGKPYYCPLWNDLFSALDFCSKGKIKE